MTPRNTRQATQHVQIKGYSFILGTYMIFDQAPPTENVLDQSASSRKKQNDIQRQLLSNTLLYFSHSIIGLFLYVDGFKTICWGMISAKSLCL